MRIKTIAFSCVLLAATAARVDAQIKVNPTGVNVSTRSATTVLLTFGGVAGYTAVEALWCGELMPAAPALGHKCSPFTIYGSLPLAFDLSRPSGTSGLTDVMSVPASVSRRADQAVLAGQPAAFFYVRKFVKAGELDQFVAVTCRLSGGGARTPLSVVDVELSFSTKTPVAQVGVDAPVPAFAAHVVYTGVGRLVGRWEVVMPGQPVPEATDLLSTASLPLELRDTQRRYTEVGRFDAFLDPRGRYTLRGPSVDRLPTSAAGTYLILLRVEASDDKDADTDLGLAGAGTGVVHAGGVAGFPMPVLRYVVGGEPTGDGEGMAPADGATVRASDPLELRWARSAPQYFRLEIQTGERLVHQALLQPDKRAYRVPPIVLDKLPGGGPLRWRVVPVDANGGAATPATWRTVTIVR